MKRFLLAIAILTVACGSRTPAPPEASKAPEPAAAPKGRQVKVSVDQQKKWGIALGPVARVTVTTDLTLPGTVGVNQNRTAQVSSLVEGKVVGIKADLGQQVRKGQVLLVVHAPAFAQAKSAFLEASAKLNLARREVDRGRTLLKGQAIQEKEVQRREAEYQAASTEYGVAESALHSLGLDQSQIEDLLRRYASNKDDTRVDDVAEPYLEITAPVDGRVIFKDVITGEHVHPDKVLMTISDLSNVWATLDARETDLPVLQPGTEVSIHSAVYPDRAFNGRIDRIGDVVDEKLRTIKVRVEVQNAGFTLKPNMYIQGAIVRSTTNRQVLAVPDDAVQTIDGEPMVFVREAADVLALRPVQVGERVGANRVVLKGLDGTETVVVTGAFTLKAELLKGTFGEGE